MKESAGMLPLLTRKQKIVLARHGHLRAEVAGMTLERARGLVEEYMQQWLDRQVQGEQS